MVFKMIKHVIIQITSLIIIIGLAVSVKAEGPVAPTDALISQAKDQRDAVINDLPYKPPEVILDQQEVEGDEGTEDPFLKDEKIKEVDWSKVPYVPSKYPKVKPAPDPAI